MKDIYYTLIIYINLQYHLRAFDNFRSLIVLTGRWSVQCARLLQCRWWPRFVSRTDLQRTQVVRPLCVPMREFALHFAHARHVTTMVLGLTLRNRRLFVLAPFRNYNDPMHQNLLQSCKLSTRIVTWALAQLAVPKFQWVVGPQLGQWRREQSVVCLNLTVVRDTRIVHLRRQIYYFCDT